ncbi:hypothetical protein NHH03_21425 [Stieleria sp. TO1_6]|uniref:hypothetical protein n=1 Tax=Stieleria tagensis TaxID=2956795 RepID=UPI00209AEABF|nr:hypothetical protein [Stieleria tagensis]MCO8124316.1 hypothetical protein [Stieleria tagensis]
MSTQPNSIPAAEQSQARQVFQDGADALAATARDATEHYVTEPASDIFTLAKEYAKDKPEVAAAWAFGIGFLIGWKCKPW